MSNRTREIGYVLPLFLSQPEDELLEGSEGSVNFHPRFLADVAAATESRTSSGDTAPRPDALLPIDLLFYIYAVFNSPIYRSRYAEFLKMDFPRVPLPCDSALFEALSALGRELGGLHLLESPTLEQSITTYSGPRNPTVGRVGWSGDVVWLDAPAKRKDRPGGPGTIGFRGVPKVVWDFELGAYRVCEKWLKDRKGRVLADQEVLHYQRIVVAVAETIRIMSAIDETVGRFGGWPDAFRLSAGPGSA